MSRRISANEADRILAAIRTDRTIPEIALAFNRSESTIVKLKASNNLDRHRRWKPEEDCLALALRKRSLSYGQIASQVCRSSCAVAARLRYLSQPRLVAR